VTRGRNLKALLVFVGGLVAACLLAIPVQTQGPGNSQGLQIGLHNGHQVVAGEVLIKPREDARRAPMAEDLDVDRDELVGDGSIRRIHSRSRDVAALIARLAESEDVEYVEPNYVLYALATPDDPYFTDGSLWGLNKISAPLAWDISTGAATNVVGVVDTGVNYSHPDLAANIWSAPTSFTVNIGGVDITCAQGTHGFNAIKNTCDPLDDNNHGTHVSGTIGAVGNNGVGVVGVNWTARIMGLKFLSARGSGTTSDAVDAIEFAIQAKAKFGDDANVRVLSNSWGGGGYSQALYQEIQRAYAADMLFTAAAGNNGTNTDVSTYYPAGYNVGNVVAVAATDSNDVLASWSNYGATSVDLAAPGVGILSTVRNGYASYSGTSMATPHVSGVAALVLSVCGLTTSDLKSVILGNVDSVDGLAEKVATGGRLDAAKAVANCGAVTPPPLVPDFSITASPASRSVRRGQTATYTITVVPSNGFTEEVTLEPSAQAAVTVDLSSYTVTGGSGSVTLTASSSSKGTYTITVVGMTGSLSRSVDVTLKVR
jgi:subtilisin family serine protease